MFKNLIKLRSLALTAALTLAFGISAVQAQTTQPVRQAPTTTAPMAPAAAKAKTYDFTVRSFQILNTRSLHEDTDHVTIALKVGTKVYPAQVKHMGKLNNGTFKVLLSFKDVEVPTPETKVVMSYLIMNSGHDKDKVSEWLKKGAEGLLSKGAAASGGLGTVVSYLGELGINVLLPNCDGWVAGDHINLTGKTLAAYAGGRHEETRNYPGVDSPTGCGSNSHYKVTWSIVAK
jgi:hypothetical protein